jgi:hypothetical protein
MNRSTFLKAVADIQREHPTLVNKVRERYLAWVNSLPIDNVDEEIRKYAEQDRLRVVQGTWVEWAQEFTKEEGRVSK